MAAPLNRLIFDAVCGSWILSLTIIITLDISDMHFECKLPNLMIIDFSHYTVRNYTIVRPQAE